MYKTMVLNISEVDYFNQMLIEHIFKIEKIETLNISKIRR